MKKIYKIVVFLTILLNVIPFFKHECFAISDKFKFIIDTIGIPRYNVYGEEINEEIYYNYNVFSYSTPENMYALTNTQRFKIVLDQGKDLKDGVRGEYYLLGRGYTGNFIANVYFPVDGTPETTPDKWNYIKINGAIDSWYDTSKYKYFEQLEYTKNSNLLFDTIDYTTNTCNSYNLIEYNITPQKIGLEKIVLNTCPTWKTYGVVTINRINNKGELRYATLAIRPMAANASVESNFKYNGNTTISSVQDSTLLNINFGANAINLTDYATKNQIKNISSTIYINNEKIATVSGSKTVSVDKKINYTVSRNMFTTPGKHKIHIKVVSYLYTDFSVDGLMENTLEKDIEIYVDEKLIAPLSSKNIYVQKKEDNKLVVSPLVQTNITKLANSYGFVEKGRNIAIQLNVKSKDIKLDNIQVFLNGKKVEHSILKSSKKGYLIGINISSDNENTLMTWEYLRNKLQNYFDIDFKKIGSRIKSPCKIDISYSVLGKYFNECLLIDFVDNYTQNMNYIFENGVINKNDFNKYYSIEEILYE